MTTLSEGNGGENKKVFVSKNTYATTAVISPLRDRSVLCHLGFAFIHSVSASPIPHAMHRVPLAYGLSGVASPEYC